MYKKDLVLKGYVVNAFKPIEKNYLKFIFRNVCDTVGNNMIYIGETPLLSR